MLVGEKEFVPRKFLHNNILKLKDNITKEARQKQWILHQKRKNPILLKKSFTFNNSKRLKNL